MANVDNARSFFFVRSAYGDATPPMRKAIVSTSTAISRGDAVHLDTDGRLNLAAASDSILGFAAQGLTSTATPTEILYVMARDGDWWGAQGASSVNYTAATIGDELTISGGTGVQEVSNAANPTSPALVIAGLYDDGAGDNVYGTHADLIVEIIRAQHSSAE